MRLDPSADTSCVNSKKYRRQRSHDNVRRRQFHCQRHRLGRKQRKTRRGTSCGIVVWCRNLLCCGGLAFQASKQPRTLLLEGGGGWVWGVEPPLLPKPQTGLSCSWEGRRGRGTREEGAGGRNPAPNWQQVWASGLHPPKGEKQGCGQVQRAGPGRAGLGRGPKLPLFGAISDYNATNAGLSKLGATPAVQVSGRRIPPSTKQRRNRHPNSVSPQNGQMTCTATVGLPRKHSPKFAHDHQCVLQILRFRSTILASRPVRVFLLHSLLEELHCPLLSHLSFPNILQQAFTSTCDTLRNVPGSACRTMPLCSLGVAVLLEVLPADHGSFRYSVNQNVSVEWCAVTKYVQDFLRLATSTGILIICPPWHANHQFRRRRTPSLRDRVPLGRSRFSNTVGVSNHDFFRIYPESPR